MSTCDDAQHLEDDPSGDPNGDPHREILLEGSAVRLRFYPVPPALESVGGVAVYEKKRSVRYEQLADYSGSPAYRLQWSIAYDLDQTPTQVSPPANPLLGET